MAIKERSSDTMAVVGARLRALRGVLGLSQESLSEELSIARNTITSWERGARLMDIVAAIRLSDRYGVPLDWFYRGDLSGATPEVAEKLRDAERHWRIATGPRQPDGTPSKRGAIPLPAKSN